MEITMTKTRRDDLIQVEIDSLSEHGVGIGRFKSRTAFIPFTIPGEVVSARPLQTTETTITAQGVTLLDASADRVLPRCPHFGPDKCGLCQWQHIDYAAQALIKQDMLTDVLERGGLKNPPMRAIIAAGDAWAYNHHMTFVVAEKATGAAVRAPADTRAAEVIDQVLSDDSSDDTSDEPDELPAAPDHLYLGFPAHENDEHIIAIEECHVLHPDLLDLFQRLDLDLTNIRRVKMQIGSDGSSMLIVTLLTDVAPLVATELRLSVNAILPDNEPMNLIGDSHTRCMLNGREFRITAGSFFRANRGQIPALIDAVVELLDPQPNDSVLDLYAGVGVFSAFIAPRVDLVTTIESYPPAVTDADHNLGDLDNIDLVEGGVDTVLESLEDRYDAAIIDPPARGISDSMIKSLIELDVRRIVYIADEAGGLARDAKKLVRAGFALTDVQPVDLAPQTAQVASVSLFMRRVMNNLVP